MHGELWDSSSGVAEDSALLVYDVTSIDKQLLTYVAPIIRVPRSPVE